jgi:predicted transcriptional regulator
MTAEDNAMEPEFETLVGFLDDEYTRDILTATSQQPMTVQALSDVSEATPSTLYRRVEQLQAADLLEEQTRIRQDGHHDTVYAATLEEVRVTLADGQFDAEVQRANEDAADRLQQLWSDL